MRKFRGLIALVISVILGLIAAKAVYWYLHRSKLEHQQVRTVVAEPRKPRTLSERVPAGMRVVSINLDDVAGMPEGIKKSDRVDVLATSTVLDKKGASVTRIILEGVEIYDKGSGEGQNSRKLDQRYKAKTVSLLVRPDQAAALIAVSESSRLHLIARNHEDADKGESNTTVYSFETGVEKVNGGVCQTAMQPKRGMRVITLAVKDTDGTLGILKPGNRVDVIMTCPFSKFTTKGGWEIGAEGKITENRKVSKTLLQNVEVLATERTLGLSVGKEESSMRVALLVKPFQAEKLAVVIDSSEKGVIRLVSRHPGDSETLSSSGQYLSDVLTDQREYRHVDIYHGNQRGYRKFFK